VQWTFAVTYGLLGALCCQAQPQCVGDLGRGYSSSYDSYAEDQFRLKGTSNRFNIAEAE